LQLGLEGSLDEDEISGWAKRLSAACISSYSTGLSVSSLFEAAR
jgi:hypothetical protein